MQKLENGKLNISQLSDMVFSNVGQKREDIITVPQIGQDCGCFFAQNDIITVTSDPITATTQEIGKLAVTVNLNDIVSSSATPMAITVTILAPTGTKDEDIKKVMNDISNECKKNNVQIIGGHTEVTQSVNKMIVSITALGKIDKQKYDSIPRVKAGQKIYMSKQIALEGTMIIIKEKEDELKNVISQREIDAAKKFIDSISVTKESEILKDYKISMMHDVTEGGILGAIYEMMTYAKKGCIINHNDIKINPITRKVCKHYKIDPTRLISSGCMLVITDDILPKKIEGTYFAQIGIVTDSHDKILIKDAVQSQIEEPKSDELYKIL